jgi:hypothetical protein
MPFARLVSILALLALVSACTPIVAPVEPLADVSTVVSPTLDSARSEETEHEPHAAAPPTPLPPTSLPPTPLPPTQLPPSEPESIIVQAACSFAGEDQDEIAQLLSTVQIDIPTFLNWYCAGAGVGDIRIAYTIAAQTGRPVQEIFELFFSGAGWGDVQQQFGGEGESTSPRMANCMAEHARHPEVHRVAEQLSLPVDEVLGYFCSGIGFGDIRNAHAIHIETGASMDGIFALLRAGNDWGDIRSILGAQPPDNRSGND